MARGTLAVVAAAVTALSAPAAAASPQGNAGLTAGVAGRGQGAVWDETVFAGGVRGDVLFGRSGAHDFGVGPYAAVETTAFDDVRTGLGMTALLPVHDAFPVVVSAGPFLKLDGGVRAGASGRVFLGSRSYNHYGNYVLSGGLLLGLDQTFGDEPETVAVIAVQVDVVLIAMPFLLGYQALFGNGD